MEGEVHIPWLFVSNKGIKEYWAGSLGTETLEGKRSLLAQLRCGILPLTVDTGRFSIEKDTETGQMRKLKPDERLCPFCN